MADPEKQRMLGAVEAFCGWYDDLYLPCWDPSVCNPGVYEKGLSEWKACFSNEELEAMKQYQLFFDSISGDFNTNRKWDEISQDPRW